MRTYEEIQDYLEKVRLSIDESKYIIARNKNRPDNNALYDKYVISDDDVAETIKSLAPEDFSESRQNEHEGFEDEELFIFGKEKEFLVRYGSTTEIVNLYIKLNMLSNSLVVVISFHEQKYKIDYPYKNNSEVLK